jgi:two-component system chemotaxis response regulator CheB
MTDGPTRVLIVDDSAVVRGMLSKIISAEPDMELIGSAPNGKAGVEKAAKLNPDLIVLDIEMPVMTGLEALVELRKAHPRTPIIMFSTLTEKGASVTLEALSKGASDYATKPTNAGSSLSAIEQVRADLLHKIRGFAPTSIAPEKRKPTTVSLATRRASTRRPRPQALIIGSSTGGPAALEKVLSAIEEPLPVPVLIVQHMPPTFTGVLADRLNDCCAFPVVEAGHGMPVEAGTCYLAPGGQHLRVISRGPVVETQLTDGPKVKSCRPSVDVLFDSAREVYGDRLVAAVLTGMGDDGLDASQRLSELDVEIIVQDQATSVVWGMPGAIAKAGIANQCLPLEDIHLALTKAVERAAVGAIAGGRTR